MLVGLDSERATAQSTYEFSTIYDTLVTIDPSFRPDLGITRVTVIGENPDAPYGLTNFTSNTYGRFDPTTNVSIFDANPAVFGLEGEPVLGDRYFGGSNELFGTASDRATFDFEARTVSGAGTITITGGTGIFENAIGEISFSQNDRLTSTDLTEPFRGQARLDFDVQTAQSVRSVPESSTSITLVGMGVIGVGLLLGRRRRSSSE
jgi:LPXTG-motif cell wall-anchored protein